MGPCHGARVTRISCCQLAVCTRHTIKSSVHSSFFLNLTWVFTIRVKLVCNPNYVWPVQCRVMKIPGNQLANSCASRDYIMREHFYHYFANPRNMLKTQIRPGNIWFKTFVTIGAICCITLEFVCNPKKHTIGVSGCEGSSHSFR